MKKNIVNYLGDIVGELELPDDTPEDVWTAKLSPYLVPPAAVNYVKKNIVERKAFSDDLIERFKEKNINEGINALQAFWMQSRMRALDVTFMGREYTLDLLNLVISGDVEIACLALKAMEPDDMSEPDHWLNEERRTWLVNELKSFLGWS